MNKYKWEIDEMIGKVISGAKDRRISSGELKRSIEQLLTNGKEIPRAAFSFHLAQMQRADSPCPKYRVCPVLKKKDLGRGKRVFYSLADEAESILAIGLTLRKIESWKEIAYNLLFYYFKDEYDLFRLPSDIMKKYEFRSEEDLELFLAKIHLCKQDFRTTPQRYNKENRRIDNILYEPSQNIRISRTQYEDTGIIVYRYLLPGISPRDIMEGRKVDVTKSRAGYVFEHLFDEEVSGKQLTMDEIHDWLNLLEKEDLIFKIRSRTLTYLEEEQYDVKPELRTFLEECWDKLFGGTLARMMYTWRVFRPPGKEEKEWYNMIWGRRRANSFFVGYKTRLGKLRKNKKSHDITKKEFDEKYIQPLNESLRREYDRIREDYNDIIKRHPYPSNILLEIVYPPFMRVLNQQDKI